MAAKLGHGRRSRLVLCPDAIGQRGAASEHRAQRDSVFGQQGAGSVKRLAVASARRGRVDPRNGIIVR